MLTIAAGCASAWAIGDHFPAACQYVVARAGFELSSVYTCNPKSPATVFSDLQVAATDEGSDLALLYARTAQFAAWLSKPIYHAELIGVAMSLLHWAFYSEGLSDGDPMLSVRGNTIRTSKGRVRTDCSGIRSSTRLSVGSWAA